MKKINHVLQKYFSVIRGIDLEKFEESFTGPDPYYANKAVKKLEHIFFDEYGNVRTGKATGISLTAYRAEFKEVGDRCTGDMSL